MPVPDQAEQSIATHLAGLTQKARAQPIELWALCLVAIALSFSLMLVNLGAKPFWVDEAIAVLPARSILTEGVPRSPFDLNYMAPQLEDQLWDPSAPLYRYSVAAVALLFGFSEASVRGWSVILALALLLPCFLIFRRRYGATVALVAVTVLATMTRYAELAREARHFTLVGCMMFLTLYYLVRAAADGDARSRGLWPVLLIATVLGHAVGYLVVPVVLIFVVLNWRRPLLSRRYLAAYIVAGTVYLGIILAYGNTLPFFHSIGCFNRVAGCQPSPAYYLITIVDFVTNADRAKVPFILPLLLMVAGIIGTIRSAGRDPQHRSEHLLVLAWFFVPLVILSSRDVKFPRYLFYIMPPLALFVARGLVAACQWRRLGRLRRPALLLLTAAILISPQVRVEAGVDTWHSAFLRRARLAFAANSRDNWQQTRAKVAYLANNMVPGDYAVTSFDDAGLGYYLGEFVYGFLNSEHDDAFFLGLLGDAAAHGGHVWFIDTVAAHNNCHTPGNAPVNIDCRLKYRRFYEACRADSPTFNPACVRATAFAPVP